MKTLIIEDEKDSQEVLLNYLSRYCPDVNVVETIDNVEGAVVAIRKHNPDVIFLDIKLKHGQGFDVLEQIGVINFHIIYTTAYSEYAIEAINRGGSTHYILKPVSIGELKAAVEKVRQAIKASKQAQPTTPEEAREPNSGRPWISLPTGNGFEVVYMDEIIRCEANENFTNFHLIREERPKMICRLLKFYVSHLSPYGFFKTHRSHLINLKHVKKYQRGKTGTITMSDTSKIPLTQDRKEHFFENFPGLK